jgi:hypothetical protein
LTATAAGQRTLFAQSLDAARIDREAAQNVLGF